MTKRTRFDSFRQNFPLANFCRNLYDLAEEYDTVWRRKMFNLEERIEELRDKMQTSYLSGEHDEALAISRELDKLIAMRQRENLLLSQER